MTKKEYLLQEKYIANCFIYFEMSLYQFIYLFREREYVREKNRERERDGKPRVHVSDHHVPFQIRTL